MTGYTDADGFADRDECKSTLGYTLILGGGAILWYGKKSACFSFFINIMILSLVLFMQLVVLGYLTNNYIDV